MEQQMHGLYHSVPNQFIESMVSMHGYSYVAFITHLSSPASVTASNANLLLTPLPYSPLQPILKWVTKWIAAFVLLFAIIVLYMLNVTVVKRI